MQVLLSTFQGAAHLPAQLASLAAQQGIAWRLLWRDDSSTDGTVAVLEAFAVAHPGRVTRLPGATRLGAGPSFLALLAAAPPADAFAFMDQDDVWLPGKLARALALVGEGHEAVCGRLQLVDAALRPLGLSPLPARAPSFASLLAHNVVAGCTLVLSGRGRDMALAAPLPPGGLHDWWAALLVTGTGGRLCFDAEPMILYRQHGSNVVGGAPGPISRAWRALRRGGQGFRRQLTRQVAALATAPLTPEAQRVVTLVQAMPGAGPVGRWRLRQQAGLSHHSRAGDALLSLWLIRW